QILSLPVSLESIAGQTLSSPPLLPPFTLSLLLAPCIRFHYHTSQTFLNHSIFWYHGHTKHLQLRIPENPYTRTIHNTGQSVFKLRILSHLSIKNPGQQKTTTSCK